LRPLGNPHLGKNLYWNNRRLSAKLVLKFIQEPANGRLESVLSDCSLDPGPGSLQADPRFKDAANRDYSLKFTSPARRAGIGLKAMPLSFQSPWPLQAEEKAILPTGEDRDRKQWIPPAGLRRGTY
jgi:hypothetical protein